MTKTRPPLPYVVEETGIVKMGDTPGQCYGWECQGCQGVSGLAYGSPHDAGKGLTRHLDSGHEHFPGV